MSSVILADRVPEHSLQRQHVDASGHRQAGTRVPQIVRSDRLDTLLL